jgi:FlaA1/EpsC-like NDP-sugar epimerase
MLLRSPRYVRMSLIMLAHMALFVCAYVSAFMLRFDFDLSSEYLGVMVNTAGIVVLLKLVVFYTAGQFSGWWRYVGLRDVLSMIKAAALSMVVFLAINYIFLEIRIFPRSVYLLDFVSTVLFVTGVRVAVRMYREWRSGTASEFRGDLKRLLIVGAGDTGETLLREIGKNRNLPFRPVAMLDDDLRKHGLRIHDVPVVGKVDDIGRVVDVYDIHEVIIAAPSASRQQMRRLVSLCQQTGIKPKMLPAVEAVLTTSFGVGALREVAIEDLLGRKEVKLDEAAIGSYLQGKVVMITGAGGSIGSEICRQACRFAPERLVMVEQAENPLFYIGRELRSTYGDTIELVQIIADICDHDRMAKVFAEQHPEVVLHAAAHKHVPLMEQNPGEAVKNNFLGTRCMSRLSDEYGVRSFVMISTDKAVNPTSVMGTTKRLAELYVQAMALHSETQFIAVRFGNVLGSNGSVVPIFKEQIRRGGPVTVTHPEMTRYFMTIPEATQLVLQAASTGESGQVFVLDMGEPVRIVDLARDMISLSGLRPGDDVEIVFTGVRPGEKLFEELSLGDEGIRKTAHEKIFIGNVAQLPLERLEEAASGFVRIADDAEPDGIRARLKGLVPEYGFKGPMPEATESGKVIPLART